jgi:restriction system protein
VAPLLDVLRELGGSGRSSEVLDAIAERLRLSHSELNEQLASGAPRFANRVYWARLYLAKTGYLSSSQRGVWTLTEKGQRSHLTDSDVMEIYREVQRMARKRRKTTESTNGVEIASERSASDAPLEPEKDYRSTLLDILRGLPAAGFEQLCQRLLREAGFQQVVVTGRSGDGGIDGHGILEVNPLVSFRVYFQCKRYANSVGAGAVRDFRGAMMGRADKGIILTTGTFTADAKKEAVRDGVFPIELVDFEKLINMFENFELGLRPIKAYEILDEFFDDFRSGSAAD